jgi:hypothetical protein
MGFDPELQEIQTIEKGETVVVIGYVETTEEWEVDY